MDLNRFLPSESVVPGHGVILGVDYTQPGVVAAPVVVYSGPLRDLTEELLERGKITLVHPGTLAALKAKLDSIGAGTPIEEYPSVDGCPVTGAGLIGEHDWIPYTLIDERVPYKYICKWCGEQRGENPTPVPIPVTIDCPICDGSGGDVDVPCSECGGSGTVLNPDYS